MQRRCDDLWQGLAYGQWLAHERRMQLLDVAAETRMVAQLEAGASRTKTRFDPRTGVLETLHSFLSRLKDKAVVTAR